MVLILTEETDLSSNQVCDWLHYLKKPFLLKELKKGHILPADYATPIDRIIYGYKNQYYHQYAQYVGSVDDITPQAYFEHAN
jgi:hypothetical protein